MDPFLIYLIFMLTNIKATIGVTFTILVTFGLLAFIISEGDVKNAFPKTCKLWAISTVLFLFMTVVVNIVLPSTKQAIGMIATYYVTNLEGIGNIPPSIIKYIEKYLKEE